MSFWHEKLFITLDHHISYFARFSTFSLSNHCLCVLDDQIFTDKFYPLKVGLLEPKGLELFSPIILGLLVDSTLVVLNWINFSTLNFVKIWKFISLLYVNFAAYSYSLFILFPWKIMVLSIIMNFYFQFAQIGFKQTNVGSPCTYEQMSLPM